MIGNVCQSPNLSDTELDDIIARLYDRKHIHLDEITRVLCQITPILQQESMLVDVEAPVIVYGDIHGQFDDLVDTLRLVREHTHDVGGNPSYLFLGDYVDRGEYSIDVVVLLYCYKIKFASRGMSRKFVILRGNHETDSISRTYGFYDECCRRYRSTKLWKHFIETFNHLSLVAIIEDRIMCMHGGISPHMYHNKMYLRNQINSIKKPYSVPDNGLVCDILWSDPEPGSKGWHDNDRGVSYTYGEDVVDALLEALDLDLIVRAHQVVEFGYEFMSPERKVVTIFGAPNYCGEFDNNAACLIVRNDLTCTFYVHKGRSKASA